jgi:hypothetical protein
MTLIWGFGDFVQHQVDSEYDGCCYRVDLGSWLLIINFGDVVVELMLTRLLAAADVAVLAGGVPPRRTTELREMEILSSPML